MLFRSLGSPVYYERQKQITTQVKNSLEEQLVRLVVLADQVERYTDVWYELQSQINDVQLEIMDCEVQLISFTNSIKDLANQRFDAFMNRISGLNTELQNMIDVLAEKDLYEDGVFSDMWDGWTQEGLATIGLYGQQMVLAQESAKQYADEIAKLDKTDADYAERLQELQEAQWDSIDTYNAAKQAIVDLAQARVDAIKEGIDKEIDAYEELINKKKESLQSDKDARDFEKSVAEKQKAIQKLEKQIAAMQYSTDAATVAKRKQLEADLLVAKGELADLFYDHSIEQQTDALDESLDIYKAEKEAEIGRAHV